MAVEEHLSALCDLAAKKQRDLLARGDLIALALTGSLARSSVWPGSDLDFWGFTTDDNTYNFLDGVENGIYWEIDIASAGCLDLAIDDDTWLNPPPFMAFDIPLPEALNGCEILYDPTGKLARVKTAIDTRLTDPNWLTCRAERYLDYAAGALDGLRFADPITAVLHAREIATNYIVASHWMMQGTLISSTIRIPEQLVDWPEIHRLYREIFALNGQTALDDFLFQYEQLPQALRDDLHSDVYNEALPAVQQGAVEGALRYLRFMMMEQALEFGYLSVVYPCLGLESDTTTQRDQLISRCHELIDRIRG